METKFFVEYEELEIPFLFGNDNKIAEYQIKGSFLEVMACLHWIAGNSAPYFSLTGCEWTSKKAAQTKKDRGLLGAGCLHNLISKASKGRFDRLSGYHLRDIDGIPTHARANLGYWVSAFVDRGERYRPYQDNDTCFCIIKNHLDFSTEQTKDFINQCQKHEKETLDSFLSDVIEAEKPRWKKTALEIIKEHNLPIVGKTIDGLEAKGFAVKER